MRLVRPRLLLAALVALAACSGFQPEQPSFYRDISQGGQLDAEAAASMITGYRSNNGLPAVTLDPDLTRMAQAQAEFICILRNILRNALIEPVKQLQVNERSQKWLDADQNTVAFVFADVSIGIVVFVSDFQIPSVQDFIVQFRISDNLRFLAGI